MCVIIIKEEKKVMSREIAETSSKINPHGLGVVWLDTFEVTYHKSKDYEVLLVDRPFIAHFRFATVGRVGLSNTHPFPCGDAEHELLMQNGTVKGLGCKEHCDGKVLARQLGGIDRSEWKDELEQHDSRFVSINLEEKTFEMYNKEMYVQRDGIWYSKANVLEDHVVAVYGTLKKGFTNYYSYLNRARFVGHGVTKDKYPLIVEGLPYLVNREGIGHNVKVDVFKVNDATLSRLDALEGHPRWYKREQIEVVLENSNTMKCWIYFNPKELPNGIKLHESFERRPVRNMDLFLDDIEEEDEEIEELSFFDSEDDAKTCVQCYNDVEYDGFHNYHCSSCGGWFKEHEVLSNQN